uniref:FAR1 domain-containing protein n=1 Tax=Trichobilharzia regenti TaxID=157069 RepID=A0AA85JND2_TRIRE|nr:unnamed protein product [Trichobilharzia regenti]
MSTNRPLQVVNSSDRSTDLSGIFAEYILGKRFFSWDEFEKSLADFQKLSYTHYVHNCSKTISDDRFKYAYVGFKCTFGVNSTRTGLKLKNKSSKCCNCSSSFRVVLHHSEYIIASHNMVHNHPCSRVYMQNDPWYRRLTVEEKENIEPLLQQSHSSDEIMHVKEKPYFTVNHVMHNCKQWTWSRNLFASQSTSAVIPRNRSDIYDTKKRIIIAGMDRINDKFGEVFANTYADGVIAGINRVLNM